MIPSIFPLHFSLCLMMWVDFLCQARKFFYLFAGGGYIFLQISVGGEWVRRDGSDQVRPPGDGDRTVWARLRRLSGPERCLLNSGRENDSWVKSHHMKTLSKGRLVERKHFIQAATITNFGKKRYFLSLRFDLLLTIFYAHGPRDYFLSRVSICITKMCLFMFISFTLICAAELKVFLPGD